MSFTNPALGSLPTVSGLVFVGPSAAEMGDSAFGDVTVAVPGPST